MRVRFVFESRLPRLFGAEAITLYPFVFCASDEQTSIAQHTVQHEMVHVEQVRRLGWLGMYWRYVAEYFKARFAGHSHTGAYLELSLEQEAFRRAGDKDGKLLDAYKTERPGAFCEFYLCQRLATHRVSVTTRASPTPVDCFICEVHTEKIKPPPGVPR